MVRVDKCSEGKGGGGMAGMPQSLTDDAIWLGVSTCPIHIRSFTAGTFLLSLDTSVTFDMQIQKGKNLPLRIRTNIKFHLRLQFIHQYHF